MIDGLLRWHLNTQPDSVMPDQPKYLSGIHLTKTHMRFYACFKLHNRSFAIAHDAVASEQVVFL